MFEFIHNNFAQLVGFAGLGFILLAFQINNRNKLIKVQSVSLLFYSLHLFLLGAFSGAALDLLGVLRNYMFVKYRTKYNFPWLLIGFITVLIIAGFLTWDGYISLLPTIGTIMGAISFWQEKTKNIRSLSLIGTSLWLIYSYQVNSYSGMIGMAFLLGSICIAIYRYDILGKPEPAILKDKLKIVD